MANKEACEMMWVKRYAGVEGNVAADGTAKIRAYGGSVVQRASILTLVGMRQDHPMHSKPLHLKWFRKQLKGLTFIVTDRGPMKWWQWVIKRADNPFCQCGEIQNAVHLTRCYLVTHGKGKSPEQVGEDREWCQMVVDFLG